VAWTLAEIGAAGAAHAHTVGDITGLQGLLDGLSGGTISFSLSALSDVQISNNAVDNLLAWNGTKWVNSTLASVGIAPTSHSHVIADVTGLQTALDSKFPKPTGTTAQYLLGNGTLATFPTTWAWGSISGKPTTFAASGMTLAVSDVPTLNQNTTGSAATLTTARTLTIGSTGKTFNGSANVAWTLAEIGAAGLGANTFTGVQSGPGFATGSSRRWKKEIKDFQPVPSAFDELRPVTFVYTADVTGRPNIGLIAEEVFSLYPQAVTLDADGIPNGIDYGQLVPVLIAELQLLKSRVSALESRAA
jgi:hypothetical protein